MFYVGKDNTARQTSAVYVGVNGVARKAVKAYVGVDNVARLCWTTETTDSTNRTALSNSWHTIFSSNGYSKYLIETISFKRSYTPTGKEDFTWGFLDNNADNPIRCYKVDTEIIIVSDNGANFIFSGATGAAKLFEGFTSLTTINGLSLLNISTATTLMNMFSYCEQLTSLNLTSFDTSNVNDMSGMFSNCPNLTQILVSANTWKTADNTDDMFYNCGCSDVTYV